MASLQCLIVTPEATTLDAQAQFIVVPLYDGELGVSPGHSPMIGRLGAGELRIRDERGESRYYVEGGFVQIADNVVSVLPNKAQTSSSLVLKDAEEALAEAVKRPATSAELIEVRDRHITQARAKIRAAKRAK